MALPFSLNPSKSPFALRPKAKPFNVVCKEESPYSAKKNVGHSIEFEFLDNPEIILLI
jgi:hypothetical protein